jgi:hypothetical protein
VPIAKDLDTGQKIVHRQSILIVGEDHCKETGFFLKLFYEFNSFTVYGIKLFTGYGFMAKGLRPLRAMEIDLFPPPQNGVGGLFVR